MATTKHVTDTAAGKSISAYVILHRGKEIATVQIACPGTTVLVNVWQYGKPAKKSATRVKEGTTWGEPKGIVGHESDGLTFQAAQVGGYGYDKKTAALAGMVIDGHELTNHCGQRLPLPKGKKVFPTGFKPPKGYRLANYVSEDSSRFEGEAGYTDCYRQSGLDFLRDIGYTIIQAI